MRPLTANDAHRLIMILEGGDKLITDAGGLTKWGISQRAYPDEDIPNMTRERSLELFTRDYWSAIKGDKLPDPLNLIVADAAFNQGQAMAVKMLQKALGNVAVDGVLGAQTLSEAHGRRSSETCALFLAQRHLTYIGTRNFNQTGRAWFNRLGRLAMMMSRWSDFDWG